MTKYDPFNGEIATSNFMMIDNPSRGYIPSSDADDIMEHIISTSCGGKPCDNKGSLRRNIMPYSVEFLADNLPAVQYVSQFYLELIIHGGIKAKDTYNQEKLDEWLHSATPLGDTNGNMIRQALLSSIIYGYSGLRKIGKDVVYVAPNHFKIWKLPAFMRDRKGRARPIPGTQSPFLYEIRKKKIGVEEGLKGSGSLGDIAEREAIRRLNLKQGVDGSFYPDDQNGGATVTNVYVPTELFCHLRHSDEGDYGISPLSKDRLRTTLIVDYISNVIDEVNNDGTDYMMYRAQRSFVGASLGSLISASTASQTIAATMDAKTSRNVRDADEAAVATLARRMKRSEKTRINIINPTHVKEVQKLPGTVDLSQYQRILDDSKGVVADIYGIAAILAGSSGGGWSTGMSSLIPFTLERTIKPFQQRYAEQLSRIIRECADIRGDIRFMEIDWGDKRTQEEIEKIRAQKEQALAEANKKNAEALRIKAEAKQIEMENKQNRAKNTSSTSTARSVKTTTTAKQTK